jgi:hypothetical protein
MADPIGLQLDLRSRSACSWSRATITAAQKKTAGAWPAVRGSRIAAGGSGVDGLDQLGERLERGGGFLDAPGADHQQGELEAEPEAIAQRLGRRFIGGGDGHLDLHH